jgi:invasion protein IalB
MSRVAPKSVFARSIGLLFAAAALFILTCGTLHPVTGIAQTVDGSRKAQSAWIKLCFDVPYAQFNAESGLSKPPAVGENVKACFTCMEERVEPSGISLGIIGVLHAEALHRTILVEVLPHDALEPGKLFFPNAEPIKLSYVHSREACDAGGCYARAELSQSQLEEIKAAKVVTLSFGYDLRGGSISTPLVCCSFAEAFAGPPVSASAHDEKQRMVIEVLVRKFHDLVQ